MWNKAREKLRFRLGLLFRFYFIRERRFFFLEVKRRIVDISELVVPPLATYGKSFAKIPLYMLPIDFSIVGAVHPHPSVNLTSSTADLNHFLGSVFMIVGLPFSDDRNAAVYNRNGEKLTLKITEA